MKGFMLALIMAAGLLLTVQAAEQVKPVHQTKCPVMGGDINKDVYVDYQGQRVYFCCNGCQSTFLKDPEKYFKKMAKENVLLESVQKECPVMGGKIDKKVYTDYNGRRVYFCCASCKKTFAKDPDKYLDKLPGGSDEEKKHEDHKGHMHDMHKGHKHH